MRRNGTSACTTTIRRGSASQARSRKHLFERIPIPAEVIRAIGATGRIGPTIRAFRRTPAEIRTQCAGRLAARGGVVGRGQLSAKRKPPGGFLQVSLDPPKTLVMVERVINFALAADNHCAAVPAPRDPAWDARIRGNSRPACAAAALRDWQTCCRRGRTAADRRARCGPSSEPRSTVPRNSTRPSRSRIVTFSTLAGSATAGLRDARLRPSQPTLRAEQAIDVGRRLIGWQSLRRQGHWRREPRPLDVQCQGHQDQQSDPQADRYGLCGLVRFRRIVRGFDQARISGIRWRGFAVSAVGMTKSTFGLAAGGS